MPEVKTSAQSMSALMELTRKIRKNSWDYRKKPFQILDNIYYVGNKWVAAYLIDTGDGLILIDSTFDDVMWILFDNIRSIGFDPKDIKILCLSHGHFDHVGGARYIQEVSECKTYMPQGDLFMLSERSDLLLGNVPEFRVDEVYDYNGTIALGNTTIHPIHTPGHTLGCTSFIFESEFRGKTYTVASHGGLGNNGLSKAELLASGLPLEAQNMYIEGLRRLAKLDVDVFIPAHNSYYNIFDLVEMDDGNHSIYIQPGAWRTVMEQRLNIFEELLAKEH